MSENRETASSTATMISCANCNSAMPPELRFCRNCGFRLGTSFGSASPQFGGLPAPSGSAPMTAPKKRRKMSGMAWLFVGLLVFFVGAAAFTAIINPIRQRGMVAVNTPASKSYVGVDGWETTENGVTFDSVDAPGGPADKAGLVGGDVITKFDGHEIHDEDQMGDLMEKTPIGKTVEVEYIRDGEQNKTQLTTISQDEFRRLTRDFERRPEGRAQFGYVEGAAERVQIPARNIYGVKLNKILASRPADIAGLKEGDVVIEFEKVPIRTKDEFLMRVRRALPQTTVNVVVIRGDEELKIPVKLGSG